MTEITLPRMPRCVCSQGNQTTNYNPKCTVSSKTVNFTVDFVKSHFGKISLPWMADAATCRSSVEISVCAGHCTAPLQMAPTTHCARIIDGKAIATQIKKEIKREVEGLPQRPGLATVLVGERPDSATYVRMKIRACQECLIKSVHKSLPEDCTERDIVEVIRGLNADDSIHGILVQLPLPDHMNEERVLAEISVEKDVDGFHPLNIGRLAMKDRVPLFTPCTPRACIELLRRSGTQIAGQEVVVLGRSNIVGLPLSLLLMHENATVTVAHSKTANLPDVVRRGDIVITAVGKAEMVKRDWLKTGCVLVDVGMNSKPDPRAARGYRLVGDIDFEDCKKVASVITPVPGGVGPMTIAMLLRNCADSAKRNAHAPEKTRPAHAGDNLQQQEGEQTA